MKTYILKCITGLLVILTAVTITSAQVTKGTIRVGPEIEFSSYSQQIGLSTSSLRSYTIDLQLSAGMFVIDNLELSLAIQTTNSTSGINLDERSSNGLYYGAGFTYMVPLSGNLYLPISGSFGYNSISLERSIGDDSKKGLGYGVGIGIAYIISNKIGVRYSILYDNKYLKDKYGNSELTISTIQSGIGLNLYF